MHMIPGLAPVCMALWVGANLGLTGHRTLHWYRAGGGVGGGSTRIGVGPPSSLASRTPAGSECATEEAAAIERVEVLQMSQWRNAIEELDEMPRESITRRIVASLGPWAKLACPANVWGVVPFVAAGMCLSWGMQTVVRYMLVTDGYA